MGQGGNHRKADSCSHFGMALQVGERGLSDQSLEDCRVLLPLKFLLAESTIRIHLLRHALPSALAALTDLQQLLAGFPTLLKAFTPSLQMLIGQALAHQQCSGVRHLSAA